MKSIYSKVLLLCVLWLGCQIAYADICPDISKISDKDGIPKGWAIMEPHFGKLSNDPKYEMAIYKLLTGFFPNHVLCNYLDSAGLPLVLLSDETYANPNPNKNEKSLWQPDAVSDQLNCNAVRTKCIF